MTHNDHAHPPPDGDPQPTAYALQGQLTLPRLWSETELRAGVDVFLAETLRSLREQGCKLIGHIKGIVVAEEEGHLFFSVTSFEEKVRYKGELAGGFTEVDLSVNVIVYGVGSEEIEQLVLAGLRKHLGEVAYDNR